MKSSWFIDHWRDQNSSTHIRCGHKNTFKLFTRPDVEQSALLELFMVFFLLLLPSGLLGVTTFPLLKALLKERQQPGGISSHPLILWAINLGTVTGSTDVDILKCSPNWIQRTYLIHFYSFQMLNFQLYNKKWTKVLIQPSCPPRPFFYIYY